MRLIHYSLALALLLTAVPSRSYATDEVWVPKDQRKAGPKLELSDLPGRRREVAQLKGKAIVLNFWATWCAPCQTEMPEFVRVYTQYRNRGVEFLGAAYEPRSARPKVQEFMKQHEMQFPVWLEVSEEAMKLFGVGPGVPATIILDSEHRIAARIPGPTDAEQLRKLLDRVLSEGLVAQTASSGPASEQTGGR
jgi:thiol-disulfide isomerase/thioredoxin